MDDGLRSGFVEVVGGRLFYESWGSGHPIVLLHSTLVDRRMWDGQVEPFTAAGHRVIRYDVRGFGRSEPPTAPFLAADDLLAVLRHLEVERTSLVGASYGGGVEVDFALEHPQMVDAIVAVAAGLGGFPGWRDKVRDLWKEVARLVDAGDLVEAQRLELDLWVPVGKLTRGDELIRELAADNRGALALDEELERDIDPPAIERLEEVAAPTLVLIPELDLPEIHQIGDLLAARIPGARKEVIARSDHLPNIREPDEFNRIVLEFLESVR